MAPHHLQFVMLYIKIQTKHDKDYVIKKDTIHSQLIQFKEYFSSCDFETVYKTSVRLNCSLLPGQSGYDLYMCHLIIHQSQMK